MMFSSGDGYDCVDDSPNENRKSGGDGRSRRDGDLANDSWDLELEEKRARSVLKTTIP